MGISSWRYHSDVPQHPQVWNKYPVKSQCWRGSGAWLRGFYTFWHLGGCHTSLRARWPLWTHETAAPLTGFAGEIPASKARRCCLSPAVIITISWELESCTPSSPCLLEPRGSKIRIIMVMFKQRSCWLGFILLNMCKSYKALQSEILTSLIHAKSRRNPCGLKWKGCARCL